MRADAADRMVLVILAVGYGDFRFDVAGGGINHPPTLAIAQGDVERLAVGCNGLAIGISIAVVAPPIDGIRGEIHAQ